MVHRCQLAQGTVKATAGAVNIPITLGNIAVAPGDVVVADDDGVVIVPRGDVDTTLSACRGPARPRRPPPGTPSAAVSSDWTDTTCGPLLESLGVRYSQPGDFSIGVHLMDDDPLHADPGRNVQGGLLPGLRSSSRTVGFATSTAADDGLTRRTSDRRHRRRGIPLTSKVAVVSPFQPTRMPTSTICSFRSASTSPTSPDSQNCGNILAGVGPFAVERGLVQSGDGTTEVRIHMVNSGSVATATFATRDGQVIYDGDTEIAGVPGAAAGIDIAFADTAGATCGALFPTDNIVDDIDGVSVTCIDNGMPPLSSSRRPTSTWQATNRPPSSRRIGDSQRGWSLYAKRPASSWASKTCQH